MKWISLKLILMPAIFEEIDQVTKNYISKYTLT